MRKIHCLLIGIMMTFCGILRADIQVQGFLNNAALENVTADPSCIPAATCPEGRLVWDSVLNKFRLYDGASWLDVLFGAATVPDPLQLGDGAKNLPTYSFANNTQTGIYYAANGVRTTINDELTFRVQNNLVSAESEDAAMELRVLSGPTGNAVLNARVQASTPGAADSLINFSDTGGGQGSIVYDHGDDVGTLQSDYDRMDFYATNDLILSITDANNTVADQKGWGGLIFDTSGPDNNVEVSFSGTEAANIRANGDATQDLYLEASDGVFIRPGVSSSTDTIFGADGQIEATNIAANTTPEYSFQGDDNSGFGSYANDDIGIFAAGANRLRANSTRIHTTEPFFAPAGAASNLNVTYSFNTDTDTGMYRDSTNSIGFSTGGVVRSVLNSGNFQTTMPIRVPDGSISAPSFAFSSDTNTGIYRNPGSTSISIAYNGVDYFITSETNSRVGARLGTSIASTINVCASSAGAGMKALIDCPGSSLRYKKDVADMPSGMSIDGLRPVTFKYKTDTTNTTKIGLIAEEVKDVIPELVLYESDGVTPDSVDYPVLSAVLVKEVQELKAKVAALEAANLSILSRLDALEAP